MTPLSETGHFMRNWWAIFQASEKPSRSHLIFYILNTYFLVRIIFISYSGLLDLDGAEMTNSGWEKEWKLGKIKHIIKLNNLMLNILETVVLLREKCQSHQYYEMALFGVFLCFIKPWKKTWINTEQISWAHFVLYIHYFCW